MESKSVLKKFDGNLWAYHMVIQSDIACRYITKENNRRVVCTINGKVSFQCVLMHKGDGDYFININKKIRQTLGLEAGDKVTYSLKKDESEYGLAMSDELRETLFQDEEGNCIFHSLTPGKQRTLIYIAGSVKDTQKRINRAIAIITHLKITKGKINYRQLNEGIKLLN